MPPKFIKMQQKGAKNKGGSANLRKQLFFSPPLPHFQDECAFTHIQPTVKKLQQVNDTDEVIWVYFLLGLACDLNALWYGRAGWKTSASLLIPVASWTLWLPILLKAHNVQCRIILGHYS